MNTKLLSAVFLLTSFISYAQNLDPIFGPNGGIVTSQLSNAVSNDYARGGVMQPDGKILVYGATNVVRLTSSNVLDTSFNFCGFKSVGANIYSLAIQTDGKIVVAKRNTIIRLNSDGSIDTSFVSPDLTAYLSLTIDAIAINSSGKVIFAGHYNNGTDTDIIVGSLNLNGSLDTNFSADGITTLNLPGSNENGINLKIEPVSGKILVCGYKAISTTDTDFLVTRFNSMGSLDVFGTNGVLTFNYGINDVLTAMDFQSDGKLIAVGTSKDTNGVGYLIARRINTDGSLDSTLTYNQSGFLKFNNSLVYSIRKPEVKIIGSDKVVIAGTSYLNGTSTSVPAIVQLDSNGNYDTSFVGSSYIGYNDFNNGTISYTSFLLQKADGSFVVGGTSYDTVHYSIRLVNFSGNGPYLGEANVNLTHGADNVLSVVEQANGKTVALVSVSGMGTLLERYNNNGNLDTLFGTDGTGIVLTTSQSPYKLAKQADERLLILDNGDNTIQRFTSDGLLDTGFASSGVFSFPILSNGDTLGGIQNIVAANNKIFISFYYYDANSILNYGLYCLTNDGSIDTAFGTAGMAIAPRFDYFDVGENEFPLDFILQPDNKILIIANLSFNNQYKGGLVRFNSDGSLDTSFGTNGKVISEFEFIDAIKWSSNNKLVALVYEINGGEQMEQFNNDGSADVTFGINGTVANLQNFISTYDFILQPDGKIIYSADDSIYRYTANGMLDTGFGNNGVLTTTVYTNFNHTINKLLWTQNGKLLEAGYAFTGSKYIGTLIRYIDLTLGTLDFETTENKIWVYPNPIESEATFSYSLQEDSVISITILDMIGRVVKTIRSNEIQYMGDYSQKIEVGGFESGNYLLVFSSPKGVQSIKIIKK
jgi:uncharacterized delta-60 repeat protein